MKLTFGLWDRLKRHNKPIFRAGPKPSLAEFCNIYGFQSCVEFFNQKHIVSSSLQPIFTLADQSHCDGCAGLHQSFPHHRSISQSQGSSKLSQLCPPGAWVGCSNQLQLHICPKISGKSRAYGPLAQLAPKKVLTGSLKGG